MQLVRENNQMHSNNRLQPDRPLFAPLTAVDR